MKDTSQSITIDADVRALDLGLPELRRFRELFFFLVWREIKGRYAQSVLGVGWAIVQPVASMVVFSVIFGGLANIASDGVPYPIFSYTGLVAWTYFSNALNDSAGSLVKHSSMVKKVYFPRLILPIAGVLARLLDFSIAIILLFALMMWYSIVPTIAVLALPALVLVMMMAAAGFGIWLSALAVQYRDVNHAMTFGLQLFMYAAPVVYPVSYIPEKYRLLYALNPMVGVVEGFRASLLGTGAMPWDLIGVGASSAALIFLLAIRYFHTREGIFADVV